MILDKVCAFFDVDETLWKEKSLISFAQKMNCDCSYKIKSDFETDIKNELLKTTNRVEINRWFYKYFFKGLKKSEVEVAVSNWYSQFKLEPYFYNTKLLKIMDEHRIAGHLIVLVSGSFRELLINIKEDYEIDDILCTDLEVQDGIFTGKMKSGVKIGFGKTKAVARYMEENDINEELSYAYGDDISDISFLGSVGNPIMVCRRNSKESEIAKLINYQSLYIEN